MQDPNTQRMSMSNNLNLKKLYVNWKPPIWGSNLDNKYFLNFNRNQTSILQVKKTAISEFQALSHIS